MFYVLTLPPNCGHPGNKELQSNGVYAQALKTSNRITRLDISTIIWDVLSVDSATYLWASW